MSLDIRHPSERLPEDHHGPHVIIETQRRKRWWLRVLGWFFVLMVVAVSVLAVKAGTTFSVVSERVNSFLGIDASRLPVSNPAEKNRIDVLLLGFRGEGEAHGGSLTDTIMVVSIETARNELALISVPRDTYLTIPIVNQRMKINEAFGLGEERQHSGGGLFLSKLAVQEVLGINLDYAVAVDFTAFRDTIDLLGGVEVNVAKTLHETQQWGGIDFYIPAGRQQMNGEKALLYVRSRFTTSDFDRARRQQEVLIAIWNKATSLGVLGNPTKIADLLDILGRHVRTDVSARDLPELFTAAQSISTKEPTRFVLDTGTGLLRSTIAPDGAYILIPTNGNFDEIRKKAQNIFEEPRVPETP